MNSPKDLIESQFPSYFLEQYPQFVKFIEEYYDFLEASIAIFDDRKNCKVGDFLYGSLSKAKAVVKIIADNKIYFEYETADNNFYKNEILLNGKTGQTYLIKNLYKNVYSYARDIEENTAYDTVQNMFKKYFKRNISLDHSIFSRLDPNTLTKKILEYYQNRGTENSFYWFFRIFFDDVIDLYYPKVNVLRLSDTNHIERRWMQIEYNPKITHFEKTRIIGSKSKATATVRRVQTKIKNNNYKYFLDLIYINGAFLENEDIIGYDIITGDQLASGKVISSITGLEVKDGGIGHKVGDEFSFNDGIGEISRLEKHSITNINVTDPGTFYSIGTYVNFENDYTGATSFANAHVESITPNYILSDYVNFLNSSLNYDSNNSFGSSDLLNHLTSNVVPNANLTGDYTYIGSIDKIKINKSGLNYKFIPNANVVDSTFQSHNLYLYELYLNTVDANTNFLSNDSIVLINDTPVVYEGSKIISNEKIYFEDIDVLIEDPFVDIFYGPSNLLSNISNFKVNFYQNGNTQNYANILTNNYNPNDLISIDIININKHKILGETAIIEPIIGDGVSKLKITQPGFMVESDDAVCFIKGPKKRNTDSNNIIQILDSSFTYKRDVLFDPIEEYLETNSTLSSEKHIQDNYYYQSFSYEITTKIPAEVIEPLLLDELHPAGFIAFIRNKIEDEVSMHLKAYEFPRIELLSEAGPFNTDIKPYMVRMQEQYMNVNRDLFFTNDTFDSTQDEQSFDTGNFLTFDSNQFKEKNYLETIIEVDGKGNADIDELIEVELENNDVIDIFEGFRLYVEDCLIRPESKSFQEFRNCDDGPFFDMVDIYYFDGNNESSNAAFFDSDGTCIPTGYGTSSEYSRLEQEYMHYDGIVAFDSFMKIINVEDQANWRTDIIGKYKGSIGSRIDYQINNHKAVVQDIIHIATNHNIGGKIVVRDWIGQASKFKFDTELVYFDANIDFDITKNFSGEFYNYTPTPIFLFDSTDANNLIYDFSNTNIQNLICITPHHEHYNLNFSNEPFQNYIPIVSGNTLANKGSYLPTTEVLTRDRGYVQIQNINLDDHVAYVKDDGKITWRKPDEIVKQQYNGVMYQFTDYNRVSITVTPNQDLVVYDDSLLPHVMKAQKIKSNRINLPRSDKESFALIDPKLAGTVNSAIVDYLPIDTRIHKNIQNYSGLVYCLIFNEYREHIPVKSEINNVDVDLLQLYSKINNDYTLPKFEPIEINYINHSKYENHITVNIEKNDMVLSLPTSNSIIFDFNTTNEPDTYISFKAEAGIINSTKILNNNGALFDSGTQPTFDSDKRFTFDNTAERFRVDAQRTYFGMNHILTKIPVGHEQRIQYTKETIFDYFEFIDGNLNKDETGNTKPSELYTSTELEIRPENISFAPISVLITETEQLLYPKLFGPEVTFDLATLSPPNCLNGSFDYISSNTASVYKFDSNTSQLSFDYDKDPCVRTSPEPPLNKYITFDTTNRTFDQTNDFYVKTEQYVEPEQILTNSADQDIVNNKQNAIRVRFGESEVVRIGETMGSAVVATIKNYRVDLKKKFFDSIIWTFDRNYTYSRLNPLEHSGFDNIETPDNLDLDCVHLFFDNDSLPLDRTTLGFVTQDFSPKTFAETGVTFDDIDFKFDRFGYLYKDCNLYSTPYPYDDADLNISYKLINDVIISGYGPHNYSFSFDSAEQGHGFDKHNYPFFDNEKGGVKPFVYPENQIINIDTQDISVASGRNDPLQTLILTAEDAYDRELSSLTEQFLINWNQIVICTQDVIRYDDIISDFEFSLIWRYLYEQGCDPSSTKGTFAYPDYYLINAPEEKLETEISENQSILYKDALFIDATSSIYEIHNEVDIITDIFSCDPIRYTDIIYGHRKDKIRPYIYDTCPGDDRVLRAETDFEFVLINEDLHYANTSIFEPHEVEIYSHEGNHLYPNISYLFANNDIIDTVVFPEIEVQQHVGNRNCAISINEKIYGYVDTNILECHLNESLRYWTMDTIPSVTAKASSVLSQSSNTETYLFTNQDDIIYLQPTFLDTSSALAEYTHDQDHPISILDRNPHIWLGQTIGSKVNQFITPKMVPKEILEYVKDKIPSVSIQQMTEINNPRLILANTYFDIEAAKDTKTIDLFMDASIYNDDTEQNLSSFDDVLDRNPLININRKFNTRLDDLITDYLQTKPIVDYDKDHIPSVQALGFQVLNNINQNYANTYSDTYSIFYAKDTSVDSTVINYEFSELEQHQFIPDRNVVINLNRPFGRKLDEIITDYLQTKPIVDYDGDRIPSVSIDSRPSIEFQRTLTHNLESNTSQNFNLSFEDMYLDSTIELKEFNEIEYEKNLYSDWKFISADRDMIEPHYYDVIGKRLDFTIRENRYDTSRSTKAHEQHEIEEFHYINETANVYQDTIVTFPETLYIDATTINQEFDEIEYNREICDVYSIIPLNQRVLGTRWEDMEIATGVLKNEIKENGDGCIPIVTVDFRPSIETQRVEYHDLQRSLTQEFSYTFEPTYLDSTMRIDEYKYNEVELYLDIPDRHRYIDLTDRINLYYLEEVIHSKKYFNKIIVDYDGFSIPVITIDAKPSIEMQRVEHHDLQRSLTQVFSYTFDEYTIDSTINEYRHNEIEYLSSILHIDKFFDLSQKIDPYNLYPSEYGELLHDKLIEDNLLNKILTDYSGDKSFVNIVTEEPHFERLYIENAYFLPENGNGNFLDTETIININENSVSFIDASMYNDDTEEEIERDLIIWNEHNAFSLSEVIKDEQLYEKIDRNRPKRIIDDLSYHSAVISYFEPTIINRPVHDLSPDVYADNILNNSDFEHFIDATIQIYNNEDDKSLTALIKNLFEDMAPVVFEAIPTIINRPIEKTEIEAFLDTVITGEHFEKFVDSSLNSQETFTHIGMDLFNDLELDANNVLVEGSLINRPNEYANTAVKGNKTFIETILKGEYYEKFIDSTSTICSELYEYNKVKTSNVILKDVKEIPWFSSNVSNGTSLNPSWVFSTNSANTSQTNTIIFFSTSGPDYQLDSEPTLIDMAFATKSKYGIPTANSGYLTANGWQYFDQQDAIPIPTANLGFESNRTVKMAVFEKYEFVITDIANTHNGYYFAIGTSPWFDNNREANALFGIANGVTYELDGVVYTDFNKYKTDFSSGLKANAKITFTPTLSLAKLLDSNANTVNGANSEICPTYNVFSANTYTFYYWSNANNTIFSAGGEIEIYELNNLEECVDYSINKTSYIDNIRIRKEVMCA